MDMSEGDVNFGIVQLDNLSLGWIKPGSLGLIYGDPGTGKSAVLNHFLFKGASMDDNVCFLTDVPPASISKQISRFETYDPKWLKDGYISIFSLRDLVGLIGIDLDTPTREELDLILDLILQSLDHLDAKRLVIDPINPLLRVLDRNDMVYYLRRLKDGLHRMGITGFLCLDTPGSLYNISNGSLDPGLFDIMIRFSKEKEPPITLNTFTIERWKGAPHAKNTYVIDVSEKGIILVPRIKPLEVK